MIYLATTRRKRRVFDHFLAARGGPLRSSLEVVEYETIASRARVPRGTWILGDLDGLGPAGMGLVGAIRNTVAEAGLPVLNHPSETLTRLRLLRSLHHAGVNDFRAEPVGGDLDSLRYPVFVRCASDHFGPLGDLVYSAGEVRKLVDYASRSGIDVADLIAVEFRDTSDERGRFTKYGAYVVGTTILPRHRMVSDRWMIKHRTSVFSEEICRAEQEWVHANPHEEELRRIADLAGTSYGRIDYSVDRAGRIRVWEINLFPIVLSGHVGDDGAVPDELAAIRAETSEIFFPRFRRALQALDTPTDTHPELKVDLPEDRREAVLDELSEGSGGSELMHLLRAKAAFGDRL